MGISIGFGLGPVRVSAPLEIPGSRQRQRHGYTTAQYVAAHRPRHPAWKVVGIIVAIPAGLFLMLFQIGMFATSGFWVGLVWLLFQVACVLPFVLSKIGTRRTERARQEAETAARADFEHAAMMRGEIGLGVHGAFPPARL